MDTQAKYQGKILLSKPFQQWEKGACFPSPLRVGIKGGRAFTLTEIIVVITILAILWLIAFVSIQWYVVEARDVKRLTDIRSLYGKIMLKHTLWDLLANFQDNMRRLMNMKILMLFVPIIKV
jgi:prepilin-type N-terminal cleavage/methylation domain-containing protein